MSGSRLERGPVTCSAITLPVRAVRALERVGFKLLDLRIDEEQRRAYISVRRSDGYTLTLDIRRFSASITREWMRESMEMVGRRGDRFAARRLSVEFVGRTRFTSPRDALHGLAVAIADNSTLTIGDTAGIVALLISPSENEDA